MRDLVEVGIGLVKDEKRRRQVEAKAHLAAEERVLDALVGADGAAPATRETLPPQAARERARRQGDRDRGAGERPRGLPMFEIPGMPGASVGAINLGDMFGKAFGGGAPKTRRITVREAYEPLIDGGEPTSCSTRTRSSQEAMRQVENNGIVFLDEIDKICRAARAASAPTCRARACSATSCR